MIATIVNKPSIPKPRAEWSDPDIKQVHKDKKVMNILFNGVDGDMFDNIINCKTATEVSDTIQVICDRTEQVGVSDKERVLQRKLNHIAEVADTSSLNGLNYLLQEVIKALIQQNASSFQFSSLSDRGVVDDTTRNSVIANGIFCWQVKEIRWQNRFPTECQLNPTVRGNVVGKYLANRIEYSVTKLTTE
ncbi:hypothetical protein AgCh_014715 [Apium graveolens]